MSKRYKGMLSRQPESEEQMAGSFAEYIIGPENMQKMGFGSTNKNAYKYNKDYGWRMTDEQLEALEKNKAEFEKSVNEYRSNATAAINKLDAKYQTDLKDRQGKLDIAKKELGSKKTINDLSSEWWRDSKGTFYVMNGDKVEAKYRVPESLMNMYKGQSGYAVKQDGKWNYYVDVNQSGRIRGKEIHSDMRNLSDQTWARNKFKESEGVQSGYKKYVDEYNIASANLESAQGALNTLKSNYNTSIANEKNLRDTEIGKAEAARKGEIDAAREAYLAGRQKRIKGYQALQKQEYSDE